MKIFRDNRVYVQLKDLQFLFNNISTPIPHSVFKKALKRAMDMTDEDRDEFIMFDQEDEIELFRKVKSIVDFDELMEMTDREYEDFILSTKSRMNHLKEKASGLNSYFKFIRINREYKELYHRVISAREARVYKTINPSLAKKKNKEAKRKRLSIFKRRNG